MWFIVTWGTEFAPALTYNYMLQIKGLTDIFRSQQVILELAEIFPKSHTNY